MTMFPLKYLSLFVTWCFWYHWLPHHCWCPGFISRMYWNCSVPTSYQILNPKTILLHTLNRVQHCGSVPWSWQISRSLPPSSNCSPAPQGAVELPPCELTRLDKLTELLSLLGKFVKVGIIHRNCHWYFDPVVEPVEKYKIVTECYKLLTLHYIVFWLLPPLY